MERNLRRSSQGQDDSISDPQCSKAEPIAVRDKAPTPDHDPEEKPIGGELIGGKLIAEPEDSQGLSQDVGPERDELDLALGVDMDLELDLELEPELMALAENLDPLSQPDSLSSFSSSDVSSRWSSSTVSPVPDKCTPPPKLEAKPVLSGSGYDMPFPYPDQIALCPHQRFQYIFSLVDSMNLQLEKKRRKSPDPLKNAVKEIKSKPQNVKRRQDQDHEQFVDLDTDCELGMEHLEQYRAKASRRDSEGNRNDPPSETIARKSRIDNPEKRSSETNTRASGDRRLLLGSRDNGEEISNTAVDTLEQRYSEKRISDYFLLGSPDSGEETINSDGAPLKKNYSSETNDKLTGSGSGDVRIRAETRATDGDNHDQGSSGLQSSNSDDCSLGSYTRKGSSSAGEGIPSTEPLPYDLRIKRNRPATMNMIQPFSEDSHLASSDSDANTASSSVSESDSDSPSSNILEMPRQSFAECSPLTSLTSIGDLQKSRQTSHPSARYIRNSDLSTRERYFAENLLVAVMFAKIDKRSR
ncbi:GL14614 [Drosophila persimilis]|uniref:GL14614 n=1 Tax=Drosophila persimilis TaxID=7234 RepID=B4GVS1_DROPE|nr:GL14614 [Drosophila persimilis]